MNRRGFLLAVPGLAWIANRQLSAPVVDHPVSGSWVRTDYAASCQNTTITANSGGCDMLVFGNIVVGPAPGVTVRTFS